MSILKYTDSTIVQHNPSSYSWCHQRCGCMAFCCVSLCSNYMRVGVCAWDLQVPICPLRSWLCWLLVVTGRQSCAQNLRRECEALQPEGKIGWIITGTRISPCIEIGESKSRCSTFAQQLNLVTYWLTNDQKVRK